MCLIYVLHCRTCNSLSPVPVLTAGENTRPNRPWYYLVFDKPCLRKWDCGRQQQVGSAYAPSQREREAIGGEGPCVTSASETASGRESGCTLATCSLVRVERDCCRQKSTKVLAYQEEQPPLVDPNTGEWRSPPLRWIVRKCAEL